MPNKTKKDIRPDYIAAEDIKTAAVSMRIAGVTKRLPMSSEEALSVLAHQAGLKLANYGLTSDELKTVREHIKDLGVVEVRERTSVPREVVTPGPDPSPSTPAVVFNSRGFHDRVVTSSRKSFTNGDPNAAVEKAFKSIDNRVKKLTGIRKTGNKLMSDAFGPSNRVLTFSDLKTESEENEQQGMMMLFQGSMVGLRNPRSHEDYWDRDDEEHYVLEALGLASLLHRMLDVAEERLNR